MSSLTLNWSRLSAKLKSSKKQKQDRHSVSHGKVKKTKKIPKNETTLHTEIVEKAIDNVIKEESLLFLILWANEGYITQNDLQNRTITLPSGLNLNESRKTAPGKYLAVDCEFVGVGPEGAESCLARISVVNYYGYIIYDKFVKPTEKVTDWRTWVSGVTPKHMKDAVTFREAQEEASKLFDNKIVVGHAVHHDLEALFLSHPKHAIRDTSKFSEFRKISKGKTPSLKKLADHFLNIKIQSGEHSSIDDARASMLLYRLYRKEIEQQYKLKRSN